MHLLRPPISAPLYRSHLNDSSAFKVVGVHGILRERMPSIDLLKDAIIDIYAAALETGHVIELG